MSKQRVMYTDVSRVLVESDEYGITRILIEQATFGGDRLNDIDVREGYSAVTFPRSIEDQVALDDREGV